MNMRIGGLASGMDIDQIVEDMMRAERKRVDVVEQNKQILEWRQESYQEINKLMASFILDSKQAFGLSQTTAFGALYNTSINNLDWVKTASVSNSNVVEAKALAGAIQGTYDLEVIRLASNWSAASSDSISVGERRDNLVNQLGLAADDVLDFTITTNQGEVNINKTDLDSVAIFDIVNEINQANIGVNAVYDYFLDRVFLQTTNTGSENTMMISDNSTLAEGGKFITGSESKLKLQYLDGEGVSQVVADSTTYAGEDALFNFGAATGITRSTNTFTVNDVQITLQETGATSLNVATNVQGVYDKISAFVEQYNEMVDKINVELGAKRYADYKPLSDKQREEMTEKQIEKWEEKAKSGLLKNDRILESTLRTMRLGLYEEVEGVEGIYSRLTQIGISTESYTVGSRGGKLVIDSTKLTQAIAQDADSVVELLFKTPERSLTFKSESQMTGEEIKEKRSQSGLVTRLYDNAIAGMKNVITRAGTGEDSDLYRSVNSSILIDFVTEYGSISTLERDIGRLDDRIRTINQYLIKKETRYWNQFTAMEKAVNRMNQQSAWLMQQFGGNM
ncbi:MAG: flagellar filament capping protein FliD [Clostridia bacterium]|nr:flagellar filament capping protein FliD [Clostridia bacterium]